MENLILETTLFTYTRFNPLIGGADRATALNQNKKKPLQTCFNPLIGGADRATVAITPGITMAIKTVFQSPHRRGGSRDPEKHSIVVGIAFEFQSPHRRGGSRDKYSGVYRSYRYAGRFNPLIGGADRATVRMKRFLELPLLSRFNPLIGGADRATQI